MNTLIKFYITQYVTQGFHSLKEMMDPFKEPFIQTIFHDRNLTIDLTWADQLLEQASKDAQEYTKQICLREVVEHKLPFDKICLRKMSDGEVQFFDVEAKQRIPVLKTFIQTIQPAPNFGDVLNKYLFSQTQQSLMLINTLLKSENLKKYINDDLGSFISSHIENQIAKTKLEKNATLIKIKGGMLYSDFNQKERALLIEAIREKCNAIPLNEFLPELLELQKEKSGNLLLLRSDLISSDLFQKEEVETLNTCFDKLVHQSNVQMQSNK